jgi:hypothetical protein
MDSYILKKRKRKLYYFLGGCQIKLALYWGINLLFLLIKTGIIIKDNVEKIKSWKGAIK